MAKLQLVVIDTNGKSSQMESANGLDFSLLKDRGSGQPRLLCSWPWNHRIIECYGWGSGEAGSENRLEFPPPIDNQLAFGEIVFSCISNGRVDFLLEDFNHFYQDIFGQFIDIGNEDSESESESGELSGNFIAADDESIEFEDEEEDEMEEEFDSQSSDSDFES